MNNFGFKNFFKPTPKLLIKIGNSLVAASVFAGGFAFVADHKTLALVIVVLGAVGKFFTEFFTETEDEKVKDVTVVEPTPKVVAIDEAPSVNIDNESTAEFIASPSAVSHEEEDELTQSPN